MTRYTISVESDASLDDLVADIEARTACTVVKRLEPAGNYLQAVADLDDEAVEEIRHRSEVRYVLPDDENMSVMGDPVSDDELEAMTEHEGWGFKRINADDDSITATGAGIHVAVIDTGTDDDHSDLKTALDEGTAYVECGTQSNGQSCSNTALNVCNQPWSDDGGHGTWCAGAIAAQDNDRGVIGVAPDARVHPLKALDCRGTGRYSDIAHALTHAADQGYDVVNMSLGGPPSPILEDAINYADEHNLVMVCASGNSGDEVKAPALYEATIAVGATNADDEVADFSCRGSEIDLVAPGVRLRGLTPSGTAVLSGTSMATPLVSGTVALALENGIEPSQVRTQLTTNATELGVSDDLEGAGLLDVPRTLSSDEPEPQPEPDTDRPPGDHERTLLDAILDAIDRGLRYLFGDLSAAADDPALNESITVYDHPAALSRVVDGDTIYFRYSYRHGGDLTELRDCRLLGVDTAEIYGSNAAKESEMGHEQMAFVEDWLAAGIEAWDGTTDDADWPFRVFAPGTGKYGRDLAVVYRRSDGASLNQALIDEYGEDIRY